jgi:hypothetical protein
MNRIPAAIPSGRPPGRHPHGRIHVATRRRTEGGGDGLKTHAAIFALVNALLWVNWLFVDLLAGRSFPWPAVPLVIWAAVLAAHAARARGGGGLR